MTDEEDDEDEFMEAFGAFSANLKTRVDSKVDARDIAKEITDPCLIAVRSCIADRKAGRVNPRNNPAWDEGLIN